MFCLSGCNSTIRQCQNGIKLSPTTTFQNGVRGHFDEVSLIVNPYHQLHSINITSPPTATKPLIPSLTSKCNTVILGISQDLATTEREIGEFSEHSATARQRNCNMPQQQQGIRHIDARKLWSDGWHCNAAN